MTMKPPMKGARSGPENTVMEKTVMASPRVRLSNMSEKMAATTASGEDPNTPAKNRDSSTVCRSLAAAVAMEKIEKPNIPMMSGSLRPLSSDKGAHMIGPNANPSTYSDTPRIPTSVDTPNWFETGLVAAEKMLLANTQTSVV